MKINEMTTYQKSEFPLTDEEARECAMHLEAAMRILSKYPILRPEAIEIFKILEGIESFLP